jgi:3-phenylpropionate/trans-cinnamate dioxygenase ferredoxin component
VSSPAAGRSFLPLERADNLHDGYFKAFAAGGLDLLLVQRGGVPTVLEGICPHAGHPLAAARIMGADLRCDMHGYRFDLRTGACTYFTEGPCRGLRVYAQAVQDGVIGVLLDEVAVPGLLGENPAPPLEI